MQGARDFDKVTARYCPGGELNKDSNDGRQLAIVLDGTVYFFDDIYGHDKKLANALKKRA